MDSDLSFLLLSETGEEQPGCYISELSFVELLSKEGDLVERINQWGFLILLPILALLFIYGGVLAVRTHGEFGFDGNVLFLCAVYNIVFIANYCFACSHVLNYFDILL